MAFSHINYAECIGDKFAISPPIILKVGRSLSKRVCFCFECEWMFHVLDEDNPLPGLDCFICRSEMNDLRHEREGTSSPSVIVHVTRVCHPVLSARESPSCFLPLRSSPHFAECAENMCFGSSRKTASPSRYRNNLSIRHISASADP